MGKAPRNDTTATGLGFQLDDAFSVICVTGLGQRADSKRLMELLNKTSDRVACMHHAEFERDRLMSSLNAGKHRFEAVLQPTMGWHGGTRIRPRRYGRTRNAGTP
ncbi:MULTISPECIES: hypothetical protein [unclassified Streptomyces]|uniref:hypothetical protein n=1 Tax=unclassified Streptomyces TaxID=2593676 RepID=UPI000BCA60A3|nr:MULTISPECIES: hypothetical protein [unclassified Streptomyces]SOD48987.1 hypothetical protein SAMN06272727_6449 [Streptomyces sp. Ag82_G6-1]